MKRRAPTQKQIAARLGVSQALVSRALSGRAGEIGASEQTVARIRKEAEKWDYQPSVAALALLGVATCTIGVIVRDFEDPYFGRLIGALQSAAAARGLSLLLTGSGADDLRGLRRHKVDALVLAGSDFRPEGLSAFTASQERFPVVQIGSGKAGTGVVQVKTEEEAGIYDLVEHLARLGHKEIGFAGRGKPSNLRRLEACRKALVSRKLPARACNFLKVAGDHKSVAEAVVTRMMKASAATRPTAWIAAEDVIAIAILGALQRVRCRVPEDVSLVGIDDIPMAAMTFPPLTTLQQPINEMASAAIELLTNDKPPQNIVLKGALVIRESSSCPALTNS